MIAPSIHHRLLFRRHQKPYLIRLGNRVAIVGMVFLSAGLTGILVLISDVMFGGATAGVVGSVAAVGVVGLWFGVPLHQLRRSERLSPPPPG